LIFILSSITLCGLILFGLYNYFNNKPMSTLSHIMYQSTSRTVWSLGLAGIIYSCLISGGIINDILSRLSFSAYLVHITFIS